MSESTPYLQSRFIAWCLHQGADKAAAERLWLELGKLYGEVHRHYHHLGHIASSLAELDATGADNPLIEGAIWFHDVIYDPKRGDNEAASIVWFESATAGWLDRGTAEGISRLITATDFRIPAADDSESRLMVDIDLAILSAEPEIYQAYCQAIRREYADVSDEAFRQGRSKVMAGFLARPIYRTLEFVHREERARENITAEIAVLSCAPAVHGTG